MRFARFAALASLLTMGLVAPVTAVAAEIPEQEPYAVYDLDHDGTITLMDIDMITESLLSDDSEFTLCDLVRAYRLVTLSMVDSFEVIQTIEVPDLNVTDGNTMLIRNWLCSDYIRTVHADEGGLTVTFYTLEGFVVLHWNADKFTNSRIDNFDGNAVIEYTLWDGTGFAVNSDYTVFAYLD